MRRETGAIVMTMHARKLKTPAFKKTFAGLSVFLIFSVACSSLEEEPRRRSARNKARTVKTERSAPSAPETVSATRGIASLRDSASFSEMDFLSKKLEDAVSGYKSLHQKISGLENRLSRLIFLLEAKAHAVAQREEELEEEEEDAVLTEEEEILPYAEAEESAEAGEERRGLQKSGKKKPAISSSGESGDDSEGEGANEGASPVKRSDESGAEGEDSATGDSAPPPSH